MLSAQARGIAMWYYDVGTLAWDSLGDGPAKVTAWAAPVTVQRPAEKGESHYTLGAFQTLDLAEDVDVVLMRQDPPFDLGYITAPISLKSLKAARWSSTTPSRCATRPKRSSFSILRSSCRPRWSPAASRMCAASTAPRRQGYSGDLVIKPLHGNGGKAVFRVPASGDNLGTLVEVFSQMWPEPYMVQPFLPDVSKGDKRIVLVDGVVAGAINRRPGAGEFRSNLAVGGSAEATELTEREQEICRVLGPELKKRGLTFVGIDVIGGEWLTEINVTSPTGIVAIERFDGVDVAGLIWDAIEVRVAEMKKG
jgi:glutathione synthase